MNLNGVVIAVVAALVQLACGRSVSIERQRQILALEHMLQDLYEAEDRAYLENVKRTLPLNNAFSAVRGKREPAGDEDKRVSNHVPLHNGFSAVRGKRTKEAVAPQPQHNQFISVRGKKSSADVRMRVEDRIRTRPGGAVSKMELESPEEMAQHLEQLINEFPPEKKRKQPSM